ncbi:MAG: hypothetical protein EHM35_20835 [Planctomycetaceae bacterium]|nr:MAG: hypothetical protein EHM35_20835 [Planctomycetaceae bacterium]
MSPEEKPRKPVLLRNGNPQGNPMNAPRCGAKTRQGTACRGPAMANGRCRMHGGASTGPRTPEGLERSRRARLKHGYYCAENIARRREIRRLMAQYEDFLAQMSQRQTGGSGTMDLP